jgi:hypothetical protein
MSSRLAGIITLSVVVMAAAYLLFLAASWNEYQNDRARRDEKIDMLLARIPARVVTDDAPGAD